MRKNGTDQLDGNGDGEFYVFASPEGTAPPALAHVIHKTEGEKTAKGLCELLRERAEVAPEGIGFRSIPALSFSALEQINLAGILEDLARYAHPDPEFYAVRPRAEVMWRAQCGARARAWDSQLQEKRRAHIALRLQAELESLSADPGMSDQERLSKALALLQAVNGPRSDAPADWAGAAAADRRIRLGRLAYLPGFHQVWLGEEVFDLSHLPRARACLRYLVDQRAFDATTARHLKKEIDPFVREQCKLPTPGPYTELRTRHYFQSTKADARALGREVILSGGRNGCYFLKVN